MVVQIEESSRSTKVLHHDRRAGRWVSTVTHPYAAQEPSRRARPLVLSPEEAAAMRRSPDPDLFHQKLQEGYTVDGAAWRAAIPHDIRRNAWRSVVSSLDEALQRIELGQRPIDAFDGIAPDVDLRGGRRVDVLHFTDVPPSVRRASGLPVPDALRARSGGRPPRSKLCRAYGLRLWVSTADLRFRDAHAGDLLVERRGRLRAARAVGAVRADLTVGCALAGSATDLNPVLRAASLSDALRRVFTAVNATPSDRFRIRSGPFHPDEVLRGLNGGGGEAPCQLQLDDRTLVTLYDVTGHPWWLPEDSATALAAFGDRAVEVAGFWVARVGLERRLVSLGQHPDEVAATTALHTSTLVPTCEIGRDGTTLIRLLGGGPPHIVEVVGEQCEFVADEDLVRHVQSLVHRLVEPGEPLQLWISPTCPLPASQLSELDDAVSDPSMATVRAACATRRAH